MHGDHLFGLVGLLASRSLSAGGVTPVTLYGPPALEEYVRKTIELSQTRPGFPIQFFAVEPGLVYEDAEMKVICAPTVHRIASFGYAVIEKDKAGQFDVEKAQALGIPAGPLYGKLKNGETITLEDGRSFDGDDFTGPSRAGRKFVYAGDTIYCPYTVDLAKDADLLIHEATYLEDDLALAQRASHSTAKMAARVALEANVRSLYLTHFSSRYESEGGSRLADLLAEAKSIFPNTTLAYDFLSVEIPSPLEKG